MTKAEFVALRSMETAYYCAVIGNIHDGEAHEEG